MARDLESGGGRITVASHALTSIQEFRKLRLCPRRRRASISGHEQTLLTDPRRVAPLEGR